MSSADVLGNYLVKLESLSENTSAFVDPLAIIQDLKNFLFNDIPENELGIY